MRPELTLRCALTVRSPLNRLEESPNVRRCISSVLHSSDPRRPAACLPLRLPFRFLHHHRLLQVRAPLRATRRGRERGSVSKLMKCKRFLLAHQQGRPLRRSRCHPGTRRAPRIPAVRPSLLASRPTSRTMVTRRNWYGCSGFASPGHSRTRSLLTHRTSHVPVRLSLRRHWPTRRVPRLPPPPCWQRTLLRYQILPWRRARGLLRGGSRRWTRKSRRTAVTAR